MRKFCVIPNIRESSGMKIMGRPHTKRRIIFIAGDFVIYEIKKISEKRSAQNQLCVYMNFKGNKEWGVE